MATTINQIQQGDVWAWGLGNEGELGNNTHDSSDTPVQIASLTGVGIKAISAGASHCLALRGDGIVWAWGSQDYYQLGNPTYEDRLTPGQVVELRGVKAISAGGWHNLALLEDGTVWAWGLDNEGELGDGTISSSQYQPVKVLGLEVVKVIAIAAGGRHSLALRENGTVWAWGSQDWYQLGNPIYVDSPKPKEVLDLGGVTAIAAGGWHSLALLKDGTVRAWGANNHGQLGDGTSSGSQYRAPVKVLSPTGVLEGVTAIAAGSHHSLALREDGTVWAWGYNGYGQLGDGTKVQKNSPVPVHAIEGEGITAIDAGGYYSLAMSYATTVTAGQFEVPSNYETGVRFTNPLTSEGSFTFSASGTWIPKPGDPAVPSPAGYIGLKGDNVPYREVLTYRDNTLYALVISTTTTPPTVRDVSEAGPIRLKPNETLIFNVNDYKNCYSDNVGILTVNWQVTT